MPRLMLPDSRFRSPTAVEGKTDLRDENVYSALVVQHTGSGQQKVFTVPQGQAIPKMNGSSTSSTAAHHGNYSETTTNLTKAGELGSSIGDASIRALGITIEQAATTPATGVIRTFGAGPFEMADIMSKCFFQLKVGGKLQIQGPVFAFPASGGLVGDVFGTANASTGGIAQNGSPGNLRRLKLPVLIARNDTVEGVFGVAGGASLAFSTTTGEGAPSLVWFNLHALVKGDVR